MDIGTQLIKARHSAMMTQQELSKKSGISQTYISQLECNRRHTTMETLNKLAKAMNKELYILIR